MSTKGRTKAVSKITAVLVIAILISSITISAWVLHNNSETQNDTPLSDYEEPTIPVPDSSNQTEPETNESDEQTPEPNEPIDPHNLARILIEEQEYYFDKTKVNTTRPDLFVDGQFSVFDVLVHLYEQNEIDLAYHFDETMNTHIIDAINQQTGWWYIVVYSGGWAEQNVFRPDHYPWKVGTQIQFYKENYSKIAAIYSEWQEEIQRKENNDGKIIIPEVTIIGKTFTKEFTDVEVTAHNLRDDVFQEGIITAIDVILSLADQGELTYELNWYDSIGQASVVRSYWVDAIDDDTAEGYCGFVYESGSTNYRGIHGNHIHLPSDTRILNSPEYLMYFWICLDPQGTTVPTVPSVNN
jgi:hypothetical protein